MNKFTVYCVCGGFGFPIGTASAKRITLIGKCLAISGIPFNVLHIGPSSFKENKARKGKFEGLSFEYLSPSVVWPKWIVKRVLYYFWGCMMLPLVLAKHRRNSVVYIYYQGNLINLWVLFLCRAMRIPPVQEACEWWPKTENGSVFMEWMYHKIMFKWSRGAMPISHEIEKRIRQLCKADFPVLRVPALVDSEENKTQDEKTESSGSALPVIFWCGMVDGYLRDVLFFIDVMAAMKSVKGSMCVFEIIGPCSDKSRKILLSHADSKKIDLTRIHILGFVSDDLLWKHCRQAEALLMPLWDDDRSKTRFPTKLGLYVAAGRPVVTTPIGEIGYFMNDENAIFYKPGDIEGCAQSLDQLLSSPDLVQRISSKAFVEVLPKLEYRKNAARISRWFEKVYSGAGND
ncbi:MAG: glycosyltransferase [Thermodesulfobacteriota bacterium]